MIDNERRQLVKELHKELIGDDVSHIVCVEKSNKEYANCYYGSFNDVIKMIGAIIDGYSKHSGIPQEDIFSHLAVALGGREIYQNNEQYETDKADWLYHLKIHLNEGLTMDALDVVDLYNLLKQSKWNGADMAQPLNYVDETTPSFKLQKAIGEAIEKIIEETIKKSVEKVVEKAFKSKI